MSECEDHICSYILQAALEALVGDPVLVGRWRSSAVHFTDKIDDLTPNGRMGKIRRMNTEPFQARLTARRQLLRTL